MLDTFFGNSSTLLQNKLAAQLIIKQPCLYPAVGRRFKSCQAHPQVLLLFGFSPESLLASRRSYPLWG